MLLIMRIPEHQTHSSVAIRPATPRDVEAIGDLWVELMNYHATLDPRFSVPHHGRVNYIRQVQKALRDENFQVLLAVAEQRVIGYVMGYIGQNPPIFTSSRFGFIADLCVTQVQRRQGIGERLVQEISRWFRLRGLDSIQMNVAHHNPQSQAFWRKLGGTDYLDHLWIDLEKI
jgi:ribosomal protein S18 acetylase RimI-like enzyme